MSHRLACAVGSAALLAACLGGGDGAVSPTVDDQSAVFTHIGFLPNAVSSQATAVSGNGLVVVGSSTSISGKSEAFRWSSSNGMTSLGLMESGSFSSACAVSADGSVIVGDGDSRNAGSTVFRWSATTGLVQLNALANSSLCVAGGVSGDGNTVVGTCLIAGNSGFRWTESSGMVSLGQFGGGSNRTSNALAISSDGGTVVGIGHPVLTGALIWSLGSEPNLLGALPGDVSAAADSVSRDGSVVVGYSTNPSSHQRAFRWTRQTGMMALVSTTAVLGDVIATAVSGDGRTVVGWGNTLAGETALVWDEAHGIRRLVDVLKLDYQTTLTGWTLSRATGISEDGRTMVGFGVNPDGSTEGWALTFRK